MASTNPRTIAVSKMRHAVALVGAINGVNVTFMVPSPDRFRTEPPRLGLSLFYNGRRMLVVDDFAVSESGGPGTGYDTITMLFAPKAGDKLWADYVTT